jgi:hypothetical protein
MRFVPALFAWSLVAAACGGGNPPPPQIDGPAMPGCSAITGNYTVTGAQQTGSTCDPSMSTINGSIAITGGGASFTTAVTVGPITYDCNGVVTGCRWDATCTSTAADGSMVRGMMTVSFTDTSFSGMLTEDFSGATNCHNELSINGTRS